MYKLSGTVKGNKRGAKATLRGERALSVVFVRITRHNKTERRVGKEGCVDSISVQSSSRVGRFRFRNLWRFLFTTVDEMGQMREEREESEGFSLLFGVMTNSKLHLFPNLTLLLFSVRLSVRLFSPMRALFVLATLLLAATLADAQVFHRALCIRPISNSILSIFPRS